MHQLKPLLICLLLFVAGETCFGQFKNTNEPHTGQIKGTVDSIITNEYIMMKTDTGIERRYHSRSIYFYNKQGLLKEFNVYSLLITRDFGTRDTKPLKIGYNYDGKGNCTEVVYYHTNGTIDKKEMYVFDPSASVVEIKEYEFPANKLTEIAKILLDKAGNILDMSFYNILSKRTFKHIYKYDERSYCTENVEFGIPVQALLCTPTMLMAT